MGFSGVELQYDLGKNYLFSFGGKITCVFVNEPNVNYFNPMFQTNFDLSAFVRFHLNEPLRLSKKVDPYFGLDLGMTSAGIHSGFKYNFNDGMGFFWQYSYSIINGWGLYDVSSLPNNRNTFTLGLTLNFN